MHYGGLRKDLFCVSCGPGGFTPNDALTWGEVRDLSIHDPGSSENMRIFDILGDGSPASVEDGVRIHEYRICFRSNSEEWVELDI